MIFCSFYSPPRSKKKTDLTNHIIEFTHHYLTSYPGVPIVLGGDKNDLDLAPILACLPWFDQLVPTHGYKTLDVIITNVKHLFEAPVTASPVECDDLTKGVPSDHLTVWLCPVTMNTIKSGHSVSVQYRTFDKSGVETLCTRFLKKDWVTDFSG